MRIGADAMRAALRDLHGLRYSTQLVSLYESYLVAKRIAAKGTDEPAIEDADNAVDELFVLDRESPEGRLYPFRWDWKVTERSGRKTVWNNTTRQRSTMASRIFTGGDIRNGLQPNAAGVVAAEFASRRLPARQALIALVLHAHEFDPAADWGVAEQELLRRLGMTPDELRDITEDSQLGHALLGPEEWSLEALPAELQPPPPARLVSPPPSSGGGAQDVEVAIDARTERMLRRAVTEYPSVLLVGPPGTGKGTLLNWLFAEVRADPVSFGLQPGFDPDPKWRTPDESWTSFELIGGLAPDKDGQLIWSSGVLPDAIAAGKWLVLDETNRADMDKIMGPLLTWLSDQEVEVGRVAAHDDRAVQMGWTTEPGSTVVDVKGEPLRFVAGSDWRLLGTYNPQDAQLVFRFGVALSRRFAIVPVPAISRGQFEPLLEAAHPNLGEDSAAAIAALYEAHLDDEATRLGPAVFLRLGRYLRPGDPSGATLAEAYVLNAGKYLATYDDATFAALRGRVVEDQGALPGDEWQWLSIQRQTLG
jgi:hypothetical protein